MFYWPFVRALIRPPNGHLADRTRIPCVNSCLTVACPYPMLHPTFFADAKTPNSPDVRHECIAYCILVASVPGVWD